MQTASPSPSLLSDRSFWILMIWLATLGGMGTTSKGGVLLGVLFIAMPAVATLPVLCRFLLRRLPVVLFALAASIGVATWGIIAWRYGQIAFSQAVVLATPLYQFAVVAGSYHAFVQIFDREPVDVMLNFSDGLGWDRLFAVLVSMLAFLVPANVYWAASLI
ncbi:MAG: hypothetical protein KJP16_16205 [Gammaproteobacteria bacterium]|nr:hypothetical protein [Gammaproteobacteria bacterium]NNL52349.1 hypothetical protein [Woeseiaceae bacterium]